jgi:iron complex outermembrane receptor protein
MPDNAYFGGNYHDPLVTSRSRTQGWLLSDTLGFFDNSCCLPPPLVIRKWWCATTATPPVWKIRLRYTQSRWMPTFGLVYKPWETLSLYANHTEALQPGSCGADDRDQMPGRAPGSRTRNRTKWASRSIMARWGSLALFEIKNRTPSPMLAIRPGRRAA